jgi:hypothetical protein
MRVRQENPSPQPAVLHKIKLIHFNDMQEGAAQAVPQAGTLSAPIPAISPTTLRVSGSEGDNFQPAQLVTRHGSLLTLTKGSTTT